MASAHEGSGLLSAALWGLSPLNTSASSSSIRGALQEGDMLSVQTTAPQTSGTGSLEVAKLQQVLPTAVDTRAAGQQCKEGPQRKPTVMIGLCLGPQESSPSESPKYTEDWEEGSRRYHRRYTQSLRNTICNSPGDARFSPDLCSWGHTGSISASWLLDTKRIFNLQLVQTSSFLKWAS